MFRSNPAAQVFQTFVNRRWNQDTVFKPDIPDFLETKNGEILVSTWGNALFPYNQNLQLVKLPYIDESLKLSEGMNWCIHQLKNGDIWRGGQDGFLFISYPSTGKSERLQLHIFENRAIRQIAEDKDGNLWLGTQKGSIIKWIAAIDSFVLIQQLQSPVQRLFTDKQDNIWARGHGLYRLIAAIESRHRAGTVN